MSSEIFRIETVAMWNPLNRYLQEGGSATDKLVLNEVRLNIFQGKHTWVLFHDGKPVSVNTTGIGKRKKNVWEPYANWYTSYTRVDQRRRGFARALATHARLTAVAMGCVRLKSLAGTVLGVRLHQAFGDHFWGLTEKKSIQVDTPLVFDGRFPTDKTPGQARTVTSRITPLTAEEIEAILATNKLAYEIGEPSATNPVSTLQAEIRLSPNAVAL